MCKTTFVNEDYLKGYALEAIYRNLGDTKEIQSILECKPVEELFLANIAKEEQTNVVDLQTTSWKESLREKKVIWWEDLYNRDLSNRKIVRGLRKDDEFYPC
uniref:DUF287 domain-containing protein n=1 Tax=Noccaea caerulescens TaxID=107243 RepID=A0A1J3GI44_NOCCA